MITKQSVIILATVLIAIYGNENVVATGVVGTPIIKEKENYSNAPTLPQAALSNGQGILNKPEYQFPPTKEPVRVETSAVKVGSIAEKKVKVDKKSEDPQSLPLGYIQESSLDSSGSASSAGVVTVGDRYSQGSKLMDHDVGAIDEAPELHNTYKKSEKPTPTVTEKAVTEKEDDSNKPGVSPPESTLSAEQVEEAIEIKKQLAIKSAALRSQEVSGESDSSFVMLTAVSALAGTVAIAAVAMYVKKNVSDSEDDSSQERQNTEHSDKQQETNRSSVYDDPLQTRFSSIVMITPNGDGVCIL